MINLSLVRRLIQAQFPKWSSLFLQQIIPGGWDNRTFRLGKQLVVRLPSGEAYASQVEKEHRYLPYLASLLPLKIPKRLLLESLVKGILGIGRSMNTLKVKQLIRPRLLSFLKWQPVLQLF